MCIFYKEILEILLFIKMEVLSILKVVHYLEEFLHLITHILIDELELKYV